LRLQGRRWISRGLDAKAPEGRGTLLASRRMLAGNLGVGEACEIRRGVPVDASGFDPVTSFSQQPPGT